ncbi:catalase [Sphingobium sp. YG1]|nr:catalase [Sphingobium sp. YG1]
MNHITISAKVTDMTSKDAIDNTTGSGEERHQQASDDNVLTTSQGIRISDNQNQLKAGARGQVLLEDFVLR